MFKPLTFPLVALISSLPVQALRIRYENNALCEEHDVCQQPISGYSACK